ncbi:MAG TPA: hypothetical protein PK887_09830 [Ignavibacteriales bacterium]|nr:hypothetical protein [Ignavibacteriales bacterium]
MTKQMNYEYFKKIFNETIFEKSKADLLEKISNSPHRYIGLFRPTKPKAKLLQNLLQSHEIRFGDAFEKILEEYLMLKGCKILQKRIESDNKEYLYIDQCFQKDGKIYFIEQKVRDDHDSSKKRGQIDNYEKKLNALIKLYGESDLVGIFYFIDPDLKKNKNYYSSELKKMQSDYSVDLHLFYGRSLFEFFGFSDVWDEIIEYLQMWKREIPELPEINFDLDAWLTFEEIKDLQPLIYRKLFSKEEIFNEIVLTLFPQKLTLNLLLGYFQKQEKSIYKSLAERLSNLLKK